MTKKLLIIRFSAMGDVAMLVPVVHDLATQYPDTSITLLTRERLTPFFDWMPSNVETLGVNLKDYEGLRGLGRLYARLKPMQFDAVADMHDVLRSKYLRTRFRFAGIPVAVIDKGRREKKELIGQGQAHAPLPAMTDRYAQVLSQVGMPVSLSYKQAFDPSAEDLSPVTDLFGRKPEEERWVGVAPFAAHENKVYPLSKMHEVVKTLSGTVRMGRRQPGGQHLRKNERSARRDAADVAARPHARHGLVEHAHRIHRGDTHRLCMGRHTPKSRLHTLGTATEPHHRGQQPPLPPMLHLWQGAMPFS